MEKLLRELIEKVTTLTKIQAMSVMHELNQSQKIMRLYDIGIRQKEIAEIIGVKINAVTSAVSRKGKEKKKSNN